MAKARWDIVVLFPDHKDERRELCDWLNLEEEIRGQRFQKITAIWGKAGRRISGHYHEKQWEIHFSLSGNGKLALHDRIAEDAQVVEFVRGTRVVIPPGIVHELRFETDCVFEIASTMLRFNKNDLFKYSLDKIFAPNNNDK